MKTTISSKGQIVLPAKIRQQDGIKPGEQFEVERIDRGKYCLTRHETPPSQGMVDWLLACPSRDTSCRFNPNLPMGCELPRRRRCSERSHQTPPGRKGDLWLRAHEQSSSRTPIF